MPSDQRALAASQAGLRLIAIMTIYNSGKFDRLRQYIKEHFAPAALEELSTAERMAAFKMLSAEQGKLRVRQVVATEKHRVIALFETQREIIYIGDIVCEEDYPHRVLAYDLVPLPDHMVQGDAGVTDTV